MSNRPGKSTKSRAKRPGPDPKLLQRARSAFADAGITVAAWCTANNFDYCTAIDVLHGRRAGHHGEAHRVAVALGVKQGRVVQDVALFNPAAAVAGGAQ